MQRGTPETITVRTLFKTYYQLRCLIPRRVQIGLRQGLARYQVHRCRDVWPINPSAALEPPPWDSWPDNKRFALVLTHDVETEVGVRNSENLMHLEKEMGFRSSFNFVPERYRTPPDLRATLKAEGFEVGVHGLLHDGKLYQSEKKFMERAKKINAYLEDWNAAGFRSPSMHHNLEWLHALDIQYDLSTFDTDPFEPENTALGTIFPQEIVQAATGHAYIEMPYTLPQDSTLFFLLRQKNIDIWKRKLDWIVEKGGMALVNVHPDYMNFSSIGKHSNRIYPISLYKEFLHYVRTTYEEMYWHALPHELARFAQRQYQKQNPSNDMMGSAELDACQKGE